MLRRGPEVDLAGIVDRQHVPASRSNGRLVAPALDQAGDRHLVIVQEPAIADNLGPFAARRATQAHALARDHARQQRRPPSSRRRSPNLPKLSSIVAPLISRRATQRIITSTPPTTKTCHHESIRRTMCASPSRETGEE